MKKIIALILAVSMLSTFTACGNKEDVEVSPMETPVVETTPAPTPEKTPVEIEDTVANVLYEDFVEKANTLEDALSIAKELVSNEVIAFNGDAMNVEPGLLAGFGNTEITGFSDGAVFMPMIGTIPFIGYVFIVDEDTDAEEFRDTLVGAADLRWNICTEADEMIAEVEGDRVFFVMSPLSFEEEPMEEETTETVVE